MSKKIISVSFSKLRKDEVRDLANRVIAIGKKHDPETLKIEEIFDLLVELQPQIDSLDLGHIAHPISDTLTALRKQRIAYTQGIIDRLKFVEKGRVSGMEQSLKVAKPIVLHHLQDLSKYGDSKVNQSVNSFLNLIEVDEKLDLAISTLELSSYIDSLQSVTQAFEKQYSERTQDLSKRKKGATTIAINVIKIAIEDLFKQIEVAMVKNQELDYTPLIDEVNKDIALLKAKLKTRASNNKKKAEKALNDDKVVDDNTVVVEGENEEPSESSQSAQRMYPMNAQMNDVEGNSEQLDIEMTVAVPRKQLRLPDISTEA